MTSSSYACGDVSPDIARPAVRSGGSPVSAKLSRRAKARRSASGAGCNSLRFEFRQNEPIDIGFRPRSLLHVRRRGLHNRFAGSTNRVGSDTPIPNRPLYLVAPLCRRADRPLPSSTQAVKSAMTASESLVCFGGIAELPSSCRIERMSGLSSGLPGTMAGSPDSPPSCQPAFKSSRNSPCSVFDWAL